MIELTPESSLLLLTCSPYINDDADKRIARLVTKKIDWAYLLWRSETYQTLPLLQHHLKRLVVWDRLPIDMQLYIDGWTALSKVRSAQQFRDMDRISTAFDQHNIDYFLLKGAALSLCVYPEPLLRPMQDLDIMIHPSDAKKAQKLMYSLGFQHGVFNSEDGQFTHIPKRITPRMLETSHELPSMTSCSRLPSPIPTNLVPKSWRKRQLKCFVHADQSVTMPTFIDLHINLSEGIDLTDVWRGAERQSVFGRLMRIQSATSMLWFTVARLYHEAFQHSTLKLNMLGDAHSILHKRGHEIDWAEVLVMAEKYGMKPPLFYVLQQLQNLMHIEIPAKVLDHLAADPYRMPEPHDWGDVLPKLFSQTVVHEVAMA